MLMVYNICFSSKSGMLPSVQPFWWALTWSIFLSFCTATTIALKSAYFFLCIILEKCLSGSSCRKLHLCTCLYKPMCSNKWSRMVSGQQGWDCWHRMCSCPSQIKAARFWFCFLVSTRTVFYFAFALWDIFSPFKIWWKCFTYFWISQLFLTKFTVNVKLFGLDWSSKYFIEWCYETF